MKVMQIFLVRSYLLQTLMNTNKPRSLPPDESLVAKPGCRNTGNFPSEEFGSTLKIH